MSVTTPGLQTTFDDNNEDLLSLLSENWTTNVSDSKWTRDYLTRLTSLPLDELLREPHELRAEQDKMKHNAQQLAFQNYPSFLQTQSCRHQVHETLDGLDVHLDDFLSSIPELKEACQVFEEHANNIKDESNKITRVLEHQDILVDLLEIPQLMETCVWNGYYSEAMDLASHVRLLLVRYPLPVIKSIQQQVQASTDLMLVQLVSHLRKPLRLAPAISVVGFLRRLDVFESEMELRIVFLRCRHDFLQQRLLRIKREISEDERQRSTDAYEFLKKYLDVIREQLFEIGNQYMSVFSNEQGTLLSDYMIHTLELVKSTLATYLGMIEDTSALTSILTQLQYCGMSLGRIGLDFRQIMVDSFEDALRPILFRRIDRATEELVNVIIQSAEDGTVPSSWMSSKVISHHTQDGKTQTFQPPMLLVSYPTLAIFTNGILAVFNSLRHLPALSLYGPILSHLEACFLEIGGALKQYSDQAASHIPDEITHLQSFAAAYVRCCIPYLKSCLSDGIYGDLSIQTVADEDMEALLANYLPVIEKSDGSEQIQEDEREGEIEKEEDKRETQEPELSNTEIENDKMEEIDNTDDGSNKNNTTEDIDRTNDHNNNNNNNEEIGNTNDHDNNKEVNEKTEEINSTNDDSNNNDTINEKEQETTLNNNNTKESNTSGPVENDPDIIEEKKDVSIEKDDVKSLTERAEEDLPNDQDENSIKPQDSDTDPENNINTTKPKKEQTNGKKKSNKGKKHRGKR
ncbi:Dor1-domain-containing protein [Backusella circina FSU 941]|nr:Dor1-domain-containing protein [Backusella circina FSU 941]